MAYVYDPKTDRLKDTSTGKSTKLSESGGNLSAGIDKLKKQDNSSNSKSSSKSKSTQGEISKLAEKYGGYDKIPDYEYKKVGEKYGIDYSKAGSKSTYTGTIQGKVYTGLTKEEIEQNKINPNNPNAKLQTQATGIRGQRVQENIRYTEAEERFRQGKATTQDIIYLQSGGKTSVDLSQTNVKETKKQLEQYSQAIKQKKEQEEQLKKLEEQQKAKSGLEKFKVDTTKGITKESREQLEQYKGKQGLNLPKQENILVKTTKKVIGENIVFPTIKTIRAISGIDKPTALTGLGDKEAFVVTRPEGRVLTGSKGLTTEEYKQVFGNTGKVELATRPTGALITKTSTGRLVAGASAYDPDVISTLVTPVVFSFKPIIYGASALGTGYFGAKTITEIKQGEYEKALESGLLTGIVASPLVVKGFVDVNKIKKESTTIVPLEQRKVTSDLEITTRVSKPKTIIETEGGKFGIEQPIPRPKQKVTTTFKFREKPNFLTSGETTIKATETKATETQIKKIFGIPYKKTTKTIQGKLDVDPDINIDKSRIEITAQREVDYENALVVQKGTQKQKQPFTLQTKNKQFKGEFEIEQKAYQRDYVGLFERTEKESYLKRLEKGKIDVEIIAPSKRKVSEKIRGFSLLEDTRKKTTAGFELRKEVVLEPKETGIEIGIPDISFSDDFSKEELVLTNPLKQEDLFVSTSITRLPKTDTKLLFTTKVKGKDLTPKLKPKENILQRFIRKENQNYLDFRKEQINLRRKEKIGKLINKADKSINRLRSSSQLDIPKQTEGIRVKVDVKGKQTAELNIPKQTERTRISISKVESKLSPVEIKIPTQILRSSTAKESILSGIARAVPKAFSFKPETKTKTLGQQDFFKAPVSKVESRFKFNTIQDTFVRTEIEQDLTPSTRVSTIRNQDIFRRTETKPFTETQREITRIPISFSRTSIKPPKPIEPIIPIIIPKKEADLGQAYNVLVKEKGKFIKVNKTPLTERGALNELDYYVDNSVARTGKLVETKGTPAGSEKGFFVKDKYNKKKNLYIEKSKYNINTQGELQGITLKGLLARQTKKLWGK